MDLDNRKKRILQAVVDEYIETVEPVSSGNLTNKYELDCSSATIRNDMAELEKIGYLEKTHTSSGRVPSNKGYRFYVDELLNDNDLNIEEMEYIKSNLESKAHDLEELTKITTNTISELTHYTTVSMQAETKLQNVEEIKFVLLGSRMLMAIILTDSGMIKETIIKFDEDIRQEQVDMLHVIFNSKLKGRPLSDIDLPMEKYIISQANASIHMLRTVVEQINKVLNEEKEIYLKGANQVLDFPEFKSTNMMKSLFNLLDQKEIMVDMFQNGLTNDVNVYIGEENQLEDLKDFGIILFKNKAKNKDIGTIGIIGPKRMDYSKVISIMKYINKKLNE